MNGLKPDRQPKMLVLSANSVTRQLQLKEQRVRTACSMCRRKKRKCDGRVPCSFCTKNHYQCIYKNASHGSTTREAFSAKSSSLYALDSTVAPIENITDQKDQNYNRPPHTNLSLNSQLRQTLEKCITSKDETVKKNLLAWMEKSPDREVPAGLVNTDPRLEHILPPRDVALKLIILAWNKACVLFRFYHRPTIVKILDSLYDEDSSVAWSSANEALIYSVLAVGSLFSHTSSNTELTILQRYCGDHGGSFFSYSKRLIDLYCVSDLRTIQTVFMMSLYLQFCADLSAAHNLIGIALRSSIREGYHLKSSLVGPTVIEDEVKKRLFWSIYKMNAYLTSLLGFPTTLSDTLIDQEIPLDIDDDRITVLGIQEPLGTTAGDTTRISSCGMNNEHTRLMTVLSHVYEYTSTFTLGATLSQVDTIREHISSLEREIESWRRDLPEPLRLGHETGPYVLPCKLLRLDRCLTQLVLYRPFLGYVVLDANLHVGLQYQISMATRCVEVSLAILRTFLELVREKLFTAEYWYAIYSVYHAFSVLSLYREHSVAGSNCELRKTVESVYLVAFRIFVACCNATTVGRHSLLCLRSNFKLCETRVVNVGELLVTGIGQSGMEEGPVLQSQFDMKSASPGQLYSSDSENDSVGVVSDGPIFDSEDVLDTLLYFLEV
ncbi:uncharacterized protein KNAG_0I00560 [Huiozyma naganishii CBS 8797]|uniref:Zn(2)-C6 fungal-type domain-containing protein n=1 Tax=Huiozyma naganishii (strain ATCC MYA-139 / BCRC 22969 / CBS 8797 / KCTC 17520 / NBRC 10181 / NCYC 3082 / Yp74L-3) TaxID=1071383 RepID=J7S256_HUIN7|nr:hypothetical protein KNAG_0I00560 [Kazachstania naganishii CBS 8797]CCK71847.1 hypothetical protein KNAG_0I00560 [Kazachstania naganishii CBS 8797]